MTAKTRTFLELCFLNVIRGDSRFLISHIAEAFLSIPDAAARLILWFQVFCAFQG